MAEREQQAGVDDADVVVAPERGPVAPLLDRQPERLRPAGQAPRESSQAPSEDSAIRSTSSGVGS